MNAAQTEAAAWVLDRKVNDRGLPVDTALVRNALAVAARLKAEGEACMVELTGGRGAGQTAALLAWCRERGYTGNDLQAGTIDAWLQDSFNPWNVDRVLRLRRELSQAAVAKFQKIADIQTDGRVHNLLQIYGAGRTGRWAGRALQLQNLKRPTVRDPDAAADLLVSAPELFERIYTLEDVGSLVRSAIAAPPGYKLVVADLANIESRVLGWLAGCRLLNRVFEERRDPYRDFARHWLGVPEKDITKAQRNLSKPPALGCGYGLGAIGLVSYGDSMGVYLSNEQAESAVKTFRTFYHEIPALWRSVESAFRHVVATRTDLAAGRLIYRWQDPFVTIELPSGRKLWYMAPEWVDGDLSYLGQNQYTNQWERIATWGGKLVENLVQAIARDVLLHGLLRADARGLDIIGHVHDEILCQAEDAQADATLALLIQAMTDRPPWCPELILGAEGYVSQRYRKG